MLRHQESPSDCTPDLIASIHALYAKIPQAIILSTIRPFVYLTGVKVGLDGSRRSGLPWSLAPWRLGLAWASRRLAREVGGPIRTRSRGGWGLRTAAWSSARPRQVAGTVAADALSPTAGPKGPAPQGGKQAWGR